MKNFSRFFIFLLVTVLALASCDSSGGDEGGGPLVISGTLRRGGQSVSAQRSPGPARAIVAAFTQDFRAEVASDNSITGKLRNDSIIFELTGNYDPATKAFTMQAPSSFMVFSITGKLTAANSVDENATEAFIAIKDGDKWERTNCTVSAGNQTIEGAVDPRTADATVLPSVLRKTWTEQFAEIGGYSRKLVVTKNSISQFVDGQAKEVITVLEVTNAGGGKADETGPWDIILMTKYRNHEDVPREEFIGKFFLSIGITGPMAATGDQPVSDLYFGEDVGEWNDKTLNQVPIVDRTLFIFPYVGTSGVLKAGDSDWIWPIDGGYSPMFTTTAAAKAATTIKAFSNFSFFLK